MVREAMRIALLKLKPVLYLANCFVALSKEMSVPTERRSVPTTAEKLRRGNVVKLSPAVIPAKSCRFYSPSGCRSCAVNRQKPFSDKFSSDIIIQVQIKLKNGEEKK